MIRFHSLGYILACHTIFILLLHNNLFAQDITNLKALNGFKEFKYGDKKEKFENNYLLSTKLKNSKNSIFTVENSKDKGFKTFGIEFDGLLLSFTENKLYEIELTKIFSFEKLAEERDAAKLLGGQTSLEKILNELSSLFGKEVENEEDNIKKVLVTTFQHPSIDNVCALRIEFNETLQTVFINLKFYNKPLLNLAQLNKYN